MYRYWIYCISQTILCNRNLITNLTGSNDFLKFDRECNLIWLQLSEFYLVRNYHFFSIQNETFAVTNPVISHKLLHVTVIWLEIWEVQAILNILIQSSTFYDIYIQSSMQCKIPFFGHIHLYCNCFIYLYFMCFLAWPTEV